MITAVVILLAVLLVVGAVASSSPDYCALCHAPQDDGLATSQHANVACYDCHLAAGAWSLPEAKMRELFVMTPSYLLGQRTAQGGSRISRAACTGCHDFDTARTTESNGLRIIHAICADDPARCDSCHSATAHGTAVRWVRQPVMDDCTACHNDRNATTGCDACHAGKIADDRLSTGPWQITHGPNWESMHGMGDLASCGTCHPDEKCVGCHNTVLPHASSFMSTHGAEAISDDARCEQCHKSTTFCQDCHGIDMPHDADFLPNHPEFAGATVEENEANCGRCHRKYDCDNCHTRHTHPGRTDGNLGDILPDPGGE